MGQKLCIRVSGIYVLRALYLRGRLWLGDGSLSALGFLLFLFGVLVLGGGGPGLFRWRTGAFVVLCEELVICQRWGALELLVELGDQLLLQTICSEENRLVFLSGIHAPCLRDTGASGKSLQVGLFLFGKPGSHCGDVA
jgi:hypothetical protein